MAERQRGVTRRELLAGAAAVGAGAALAGGADAAAETAADATLDVVVIGAGLAGLTAARDLVRAGASVRVLEARARVGGRTLNAQIEGGFAVEVGGEWVGPSQTAILDLCRELELGTYAQFNTGKAVFVTPQERLETDPLAAGARDLAFDRRIDALAREVPLDAPWRAQRAAEWDAMTLEDWLEDQPASSALDRAAFDLGIALTYGAPASALSFLWFLYYVRSAGSFTALETIEGGAQDSRIAGGSQAVSLALAKVLGERVVLASPVRKIESWSEDAGAVSVHTRDRVWRARRAIVAMSPSCCAALEFAPRLPAARAGLHESWPTNGHLTKADLVYERPFWRDAGLSGQSFMVGGPYLWSMDNTPPGSSRGVLLAFADTTRLADTREAGGRQLAEAFARAFGEQALRPREFHEQIWGAEVFTQGCVSPLGPGLLTRYGSALRAPTGRIVWAGTETAEIWNGYMDGAVRSGHRAALEALGMLRAA